MKKYICLLLSFLLLGLTACGSSAEPADAVTASEAPVSLPDPTPEPFPDWADIYRSFIEENASRLQETCFGGVAGIGYIDLDLDNTPELILFDSGSSASMGVQIFDITPDRTVTCVSASSVAVGEAFGTDHLSPLYINTLDFEEFRLMRRADDSLCFEVLSRNGAENFNFQERVRFLPGEGNVVSLESCWYCYISSDPATGNVISAEYSVWGQPVDKETFDQASALPREELDYTADGIFIWSGKNYGYDRVSFLTMIDDAAKAYRPVL